METQIYKKKCKYKPRDVLIHGFARSVDSGFPVFITYGIKKYFAYIPPPQLWRNLSQKSLQQISMENKAINLPTNISKGDNKNNKKLVNQSRYYLYVKKLAPKDMQFMDILLSSGATLNNLYENFDELNYNEDLVITISSQINNGRSSVYRCMCIRCNAIGSRSFFICRGKACIKLAHPANSICSIRGGKRVEYSQAILVNYPYWIHFAENTATKDDVKAVKSTNKVAFTVQIEVTDRERFLDEINYVKKIGRGSFGGVYAGYHKTHKYVAIKHFKNAANYMEECDILRSLNHPHIIKYIGQYQFVDGDIQYSMLYTEVMDYNLYNCVCDDRRPQSRKALSKQVIIDVIKTIKWLNIDKKIIDGDLKKENILVKVTGNRSITLKVCDFGSAKKLPILPNTRIPSSAPYSPTNGTYMKSDSFSVGIILFELTGDGQLDNGYRSIDDKKQYLNNIYKSHEWWLNRE